MFDKIKTLLKRPSTYVLILIGVVLAVAYAAKIPAFIKKGAGYLPGSTAPAA